MQINDQTFSNYTPKIGLIGGLAIRAGVFYYEQILKNSIENDKSLRLVFSHAEVNIVLALQSQMNYDKT